MKTMKAENSEALAKNETAIERLLASNAEYRADNERLRADMERNVNTITVRVMGAIGLLGVFIAVLQYFNK